MRSNTQNNLPTLVDIVIIGGGLAGLTCAIHLSKNGFSVIVIEKHSYPAHKVCGEYVSNEVLPYLRSLEVDPFRLGATSIDELVLSTSNGRSIRSKLPLGGFGISRYAFDAFLSDKAIERGAKLVRDTVTRVVFDDEKFRVETKASRQFECLVAIGAYGKRSGLDKKLDRPFIRKRAPFIAVKLHVKGNFPNNMVGLHNFEGGYCGVSKVENGDINLCYIAKYKLFRKYKNIDQFQKQVICKNRHLKTIFDHSQPLFSKPLSISQISFAPKSVVEGHVLMCGDTAGLIHPLCGNGMSMAIRSARMLSALVTQFLNGEFRDRTVLEKLYREKWTEAFRWRLLAGRLISRLFELDWISELVLHGLKPFPGLLKQIIRMTHGKPMLTE